MSERTVRTKESNNENIERTIKLIIRKLPVMLAAAAVALLIGLGFAYRSYSPAYMARGTYMILFERIIDEGTTGTDNDYTIPRGTATSFRYMLLSDDVIQSVIEESSIKVDPSDLRSMLNLNMASNSSSVMHISVTAGSAQRAYDLCVAVTEVMPKQVKVLNPNYSLTVLNAPKKPRSAQRDWSLVITPAIFAMGAFALTMIIVMILDFFKDTIRSPRDISARLGVNMLGVLPAVKERKKNQELATLRSLRSDRRVGFTYVENCKAIRSKIEAISMRKKIKRVLITSAVASEGKTTVALNLAQALAQNGKRVCVVDADLRKPMVHNCIRAVNDQGGLIGILQDGRDYTECVKEATRYGIGVCLSGGVSDKPIELFSSARMGMFLEELDHDFDYILIDSPPVALVADAYVISSLVDAVLLVIKQDVAPVYEIEQAVEEMGVRNADVIGCVLNGYVNKTSLNKFYSSYYTYYGRGGSGKSKKTSL